MGASLIGIDEVGRGCWAGPLLVVAARSSGELPTGLADSKRISKDKRQRLAPLIKAACDIGEGWVSPKEIDELGLSKAMQLGVMRALLAIEAQPHEIIIMDGNINYCAAKFRESRAVIDADALYPVVSAASIWAKVARDTYMAELDEKYAMYQFAQHVGYGTALHKQMLLLHGVSDIHRRSFKPIAALEAL
jgi:ribonuclease HII